MEGFDISHKIVSHPQPKHPDAIFSILIPSWKNFQHLKLLVESIQKNSTFHHQICVHLNGHCDQSVSFLTQEKISFTISQENVGVCVGTNAASSLAKCDYILILNDDMYVAPGWDTYLLEQIQKRQGDLWCLSGTMIEWEEKHNPCVIVGKNYGQNAESFDEILFLKEYDSYSHKDWNGSQWYPLVVPRSIWSLVGGLSVEFSPGMYSDPDFMMKLWKIGVRDFLGIGKSRVYHFMSKSTERVKKNDGRTQFLLKWKVSSSTFLKYYLRLGTPYSGILDNPDPQTFRMVQWKDNIKSKLKAIF